jgi:hypothetical protein
MTDTTPRLRLPLMTASQAQKHVTHNEALMLIDLLVGVIPVLSRSLSEPPEETADGDVFIVAGTGAEAWEGFDADDVVLMIDGGWRRVTATRGMMASLASEGGALVWYDGEKWASSMSGAGTGSTVTETDDFTIGGGHYARTVRVNSSTAVAVTLPKTAGAGVALNVLQAGDGFAEFEPESGASLFHRMGHTRTGGRWSLCSLLVESNAGGSAAAWVLSGETQASGVVSLPGEDLTALVDYGSAGYVYQGQEYASQAAFLTAIGGGVVSSTYVHIGPFVEPGATELLTNGDFSEGSTGWTAGGASIAVVDGELQVTGSGGNGSTAYRSISGIVQPSGRAYRLAGKVRRGTATNVTLGFGSGAGGGTANYAQTANITATSMEAVALYCGGFHATTPVIAVRHLVNPSTGTYLADDLSIKEALPYPGFKPGELCGLVEGNTPSTTGTDRVVFQADDNADFNGNWFERNFIRLIWKADGTLHFVVSFGGTGSAVDQVDFNLGSVAASTSFAVAFTAKENDFRAAMLGRPVQVDTSGSFPGIAGIRIGKARSAAALMWTGTVDRVRLYQRAAEEVEFLGLAGGNGLVAWGDSLAAGAGSTGGSTGNKTLPAQAQGLFSPARSVVNRGVGGQTSTQIAARMNARPINVTVTGNAIPASGGVVVTDKNINVLTASGTFAGTQTGWLAGVRGTMSTDSGGVWTFTRKNAGAVVPCPPGSSFVCEAGQVLRPRTSWLWIGRNGAQSGYTVQDDIAAAVASLGHSRYLVGSILTSAADTSGGKTSILALNSDLQATYGDRYVDVLGALQAENDGSANDLADVAASLVPRSLRSDHLHLNDDGYLVAAEAFKAAHDLMGY